MKSPTRYKRAVGLEFDEYDRNQEAPIISVKGMHVSADKVVEIAKRNGIPVVEDPGLAKILHQLDLDQRIPATLFRSVAAVLQYVRRWVR